MPSTDTYRLALPAGYQLREYRLEGVLGQGGFGITYVAWDTAMERRVAIKEYLPREIASRHEASAAVKPTSKL